MSGLVKRSYLSPDPNEFQYDACVEAQCNTDESQSKCQRQHSTSDHSRSLSEQHYALLSNIPGFRNRNPALTEPNCEMAGNYNVDRELRLQPGTGNSNSSYVDPSHFSIPDSQLAAILDHNSGRAETITNHRSDGQGRIDPSLLYELFPSNHGVNSTPAEGTENFGLPSNRLSLWNHDLEAAGTSLASDVWDYTINRSWRIDALLDAAANSPTNGYATSLTDDSNLEAEATFLAQAYTSHAQPRNTTTARVVKEDVVESRCMVQIQKRPNRKILPLLHEQGPFVAEPALYRMNTPPGPNERSRNHMRRSKLGRSKSLGPVAAKHAAEVRKVRACSRCRIMRIRCTPGEICETCQSLTVCSISCIRFGFDEFTEYFFPATVNSSYKESVVEQFFKENVVPGFNGNMIEAQISSGPAYQPITLFIHEFHPSNDDFLAISQIKTGDDGKLGLGFTQNYAPPFILPQSSNTGLRQKCLEHVELIAKGPRSKGELHYKDTSAVSWEVFNAIAEYQRSVHDELVGNAIVLYTMHFFMTQNLVFTDDSADTVLRSLKSPAKLPYARTLTSNLITLQIKQVMHDLVHEKTAELLKLLENSIVTPGPNLKSRWASSFCAISILCMCAEMVQSATDLKTVHMISEEGYSNLSRFESMEQCRERPIFEFTQLFHKGFRSFQRSGTRKTERGFNPIRDGLNNENREGLEKPMIELINDIVRILVEHERDVRERVPEPSLEYNPDDLGDLLNSHLTFREKNSGRLVSKFLLSFYQLNRG